MLREAGFRYFALYEQHKPILLPLEYPGPGRLFAGRRPILF